MSGEPARRLLKENSCKWTPPLMGGLIVHVLLCTLSTTERCPIFGDVTEKCSVRDVAGIIAMTAREKQP